MKIRINGQLLLLMLAEKLLKVGVKLIQSNTDGIFYLAEKELLPEIDKVCKEWESITKLKLEADYFEAFYQFAINDYVGVKEGFSKTKDPKLIKKKGLFIDEVVLGKGMAPMIIPEAIIRYFVYGEDPKQTIFNCNDIKKFLTYQKVSKEFSVEYNGNLIQHINRYYASITGSRLLKCKVDPTTKKRTNYISMCSSNVTLYNTFDDVPIKDRHINYYYYLNEVYKIIEPIEKQQLSLF